MIAPLMPPTIHLEEHGPSSFVWFRNGPFVVQTWYCCITVSVFQNSLTCCNSKPQDKDTCLVREEGGEVPLIDVRTLLLR